jgi:hypothetical protein
MLASIVPASMACIDSRSGLKKSVRSAVIDQVHQRAIRTTSS